MVLTEAFQAARVTAQALVQRAVFGTLRAADLDTVQRPIPGFSSMCTVPADWMNGIVAARVVANVARNTMHDYAREARGDGITWLALADPLGIPTDDDLDRADAAFELIAGRPAMRFDRVLTGWRCSTCERHVTDYGPVEPDPGARETGHASDCTRHLGEIRAYLADD